MVPLGIFVVTEHGHWQELTLDEWAGPVFEGDTVYILGHLCLIQSVHIFLADGQIEELQTCSNSSFDIVIQDKHGFLCISVFDIPDGTQFPHSLAYPLPHTFFQSKLFSFPHGTDLSGVTFPLKNLFYELKYQNRIKKLIHLPSSSLTAFSHYRLCIKIKLLTC